MPGSDQSVDAPITDSENVSRPTNGSLTAPHSGQQRRDLIREYLLANGSASPTELAERFNVSVMTVHRDLVELEQEGVVRRFRGGVTAQPSAVFESNVAYRLKAMQAEKEAIAARARRFVEPGMAILLDDSTTCMALARALRGITPLTVVTNDLGSLDILSEVPGIRLIGLGGDYDAKYNSFVGMACIAAVQSLSVDIAFVSVYGVYGRNAYHQEQHIVSGKRAMIACGQRKVLLVDHSKLGRLALHQVCDLSVFDTVVIDAGASPEALRELQECRVNYEIATPLQVDDRANNQQASSRFARSSTVDRTSSS